MGKAEFQYSHDPMIYQNLATLLGKILNRHLWTLIPDGMCQGEGEEVAETCEKLKEFCCEFIDAEKAKYLQLLSAYSE